MSCVSPPWTHLFFSRHIERSGDQRVSGLPLARCLLQTERWRLDDKQAAPGREHGMQKRGLPEGHGCGGPATLRRRRPSETGTIRAPLRPPCKLQRFHGFSIGGCWRWAMASSSGGRRGGARSQGDAWRWQSFGWLWLALVGDACPGVGGGERPETGGLPNASTPHWPSPLLRPS